MNPKKSSRFRIRFHISGADTAEKLLQFLIDDDELEELGAQRRIEAATAVGLRLW